MARSQSRSLRSRPLLRTALAFLICFTLLAAFSATAAAAPPTMDRSTSTYAGAFSDECVFEQDDTWVCSYQSMEVFSENQGWVVCVHTFSVTYPPAGEPTYAGESGCTDITGNGFSIDAKKLTSAALAPMTLTLYSYVCDEFTCEEISRDVTISGTWTGTGNVIRYNNRSTYQDGKCKYTTTGKGEFRYADATFTIDGQGFQALSAMLGTSKTAFKISAECW